MKISLSSEGDLEDESQVVMAEAVDKQRVQVENKFIREDNKTRSWCFKLITTTF